MAEEDVAFVEGVGEVVEEAIEADIVVVVDKADIIRSIVDNNRR